MIVTVLKCFVAVQAALAIGLSVAGFDVAAALAIWGALVLFAIALACEARR